MDGDTYPTQRYEHVYQNVPWRHIRIDHFNYQREQSDKKIRDIAEGFDPDAFGYVVVGERRDGTFWAIDGGHRLMAMERMGWTDQNVPCLILRYTTSEDEARLYDVYNGHRGMPRVADRMKAQLHYRKPDAVAIKAIVEDCGYTLYFGRGKPPAGHIGSVSALVKVYNNGKPGDLFKVLTFLRETWGDDTQAVAGQMIVGTWLFMTKYRNQFELGALADRLRGTSPRMLANRARQIAEVMGITVPVGVGRAILYYYNHNKRQNRLPEWEATSDPA